MAPTTVPIRSSKVAIPSAAIAAAIVLALLITYAYLTSIPLNHDVSWLLTATQRWAAGQRLYVDIIEINPPLIFLENLLLTGGLLTKPAYLAGVTVTIGISACVVLMQRGARLAAVATIAMITSGITDYGQRDHLALIFLVPFLLTQPTSSLGRAALGGWAFLGVGLKPHFALIPAAFVAARCWQQRSAAPLREIQVVALASLCTAWLVTAYIVWPTYFSTIIPLAALVYDAFGFDPSLHHFAVSLITGLILILIARRDPTLLPLACAAAGAVGEFFIQGRFWSYQFVPALGLTTIITLQAGLSEKGLFRWTYLSVGVVLIAWPLHIGPHRYQPSIIPQGVKSVLFLSERVSATYPQVAECGVNNESRYPSLWTLPGAWKRISENSPDGLKARSILQREFKSINDDIKSGRPEIIFEDSRPTYFGGTAFTYSYWINMDNYRQVDDRGRYRVWLRNDLATELLDRPTCLISGIGSKH